MDDYDKDCEADDALPKGCCYGCAERLAAGEGIEPGHFECYVPPEGWDVQRHTDGRSWVAHPPLRPAS